MFRNIFGKSKHEPDQQKQQLEKRANDYQSRADDAMYRGVFDQAFASYKAALDIARELAQTYPDEPVHIKAQGGNLYGMAGALNAMGDPLAAIEALNESEQKYRLLGMPDLIADVQARRGFAYHGIGYGVSAVLELDKAVTVYRKMFTANQNTAVMLNLARVLAMSATVLRDYGDPDLAVAAADHAIKLYGSMRNIINGTPGAALHTSYYQLAAAVASEIHAAHGRMEIALVADDLCIHAARSLLPRGNQQDKVKLAQALTRKSQHLQVVNQNGEPLLKEAMALHRAAAEETLSSETSQLSMTLAASLAVGANDLAAVLTKPAVDLKLISPGDRCPLQVAHTYAGKLAEIALALLPKRKAEGLRLGLEAHYLFAIASREQTPAMRYQMSEHGPLWKKTLDACAQVFEADGQTSMARDLAKWSQAVAQALPWSMG